MKVGFFISSVTSKGGTERVLSVVCNELIRRGYEVHIISMEKTLGKPFFYFSDEIRIKSVFSKNKIKLILKLRNILKQENYDVYFDVDSILTTFSFLALRGLRTKHICWEHFYFGQNIGVYRRQIGRYLALIFADKVLTLTDSDRDRWRKYLLVNKSKVISIANPSCYESINDNGKIRKNIIVSIGHLTKNKGFDLLLRAWVIVASKFKYPESFELHIYGAGPEEGYLKELTTSLGIQDTVTFKGTTEFVDEVLRESILYTSSSKYEGFGLTLVEALSCGTPVICFDCPVGPKHIIDSSCGLLVDNLDVDKLGLAISETINNKTELEAMSNNAIEKSKSYQIKYIVDKWELDIFNEIRNKK